MTPHSILVIFMCRHAFFLNEPTIPMLYLIHHRKFGAVHNEFFRICRQLCPQLEHQIIITDREAGIISAINSQLPMIRHAFCWNHIQMDVKYYLERKKASADDKVVYVSHIYDLLESIDDKYYEIKLEKMKEHWSPEFIKHYLKHLDLDIKKICKYVLEELGIYTHQAVE